MAISETKQQKGACNVVTKIAGFESVECLRPTSATGGIMVWLKKGSGKAVRKWDTVAADTISWMNSERVWIIMEDDVTKVACSDKI